MKHYVLKLRTGRGPQALMQRIEGRKAMDVLAGLCLGILADGEISSREAAFLEEWAQAHAHSLPAFVGAKLVPKLHLLRRGAEASDELIEELVSVLYDMVGMGDHGRNGGKVDLVGSA